VKAMAQEAATPRHEPPSRRHAIITGGSRGVGLALARRLRETGYNLTLVARDAGRLSRAADGLVGPERETAQLVKTIAADFHRPQLAHDAISDGCAALGSPDLLICAAGIARPRTFDALTVDDFRELINVNFLAVVASVKAALPSMRAARRGHIVLLSSGAALVGLYGQSAYGASKFALRGLAEALRAELRDDGVGISICYPPNTDTDMLAAALTEAPAPGRAVMTQARTLSADAVARAILVGIEHRQFEIVPGLEMRVLNRFHSVLKPLLFAQLDRIARTAEATRG
jgi:3-dehydrosphinganine reductase